MDWLEALLLGLIQGLTEFLPVSSSGHLELGKALLNIDPEKSLIFTVLVHGATVLSTIVVFYKDIGKLMKGFFVFRWNEETKYIVKLMVSMIPIAVIGFFFQQKIEKLFNGNAAFVGYMLIITAVLLASTYLRKTNIKKVTYFDSFLIGIAQVLAVIPGISRSGATISAGLMLGIKKENIARFSFLMVLVPIIAANLRALFIGDFSNETSIGTLPLIIGFIAAFISGLLACKWMIGIIKKGKLIYFALYCFIIGLIAIFII